MHYCAFLLALSLAACASDSADAVRSWLVVSQAEGAKVGVIAKIGTTVYPAASLLAADEQGVRLRADELNASLPWKALGDEGVCLLAENLAPQAPNEVKAAWLVLAAECRHNDSPRFRPLLDDLRRADASAATRVDTAIAAAKQPAGEEPKPAGEAAKEAKPAAADKPAGVEPAADPLAGLLGGDVAAADMPLPTTISEWDAWIFDKTHKLKRESYLTACWGMELKDLDRRLGPSHDFLNGKKSASASPKPAAKTKNDTAPTVDGFALDAIRFPEGTWWWKRPEKPAGKDWTGHGGEVVFLPDQTNAPGSDKVQFTWALSENHGGTQFWHSYKLRPLNSTKDGSEYWTSSPNGALVTPGFASAMGGDPVKVPIALGRSSCCWNTHALLAFRNGYITDSGCGNAGPDGRVQCQLPPGLVPSAVAITPNNEFGLVTVWNVEKLKGQLAVLALDVEGQEVAGKRNWMIPGDGFLAHAKYLGCIDLPFATPSGVSASCDWCSSGGFDAPKHYNPWKADQAARDAMMKAPPGATRDGGPGYGRAGYAAVISRAENKLALVDLSPLFAYVREICFTSEKNAAQIKDEGPGDKQWPHAFSAMPATALPKVVQTITVQQPTAVSCGFPLGSDLSWQTSCVVATMDGKVIVFDVGALNSTVAKPGPAVAMAMARIGRNPVVVNHGSRSLQPANSVLITCRADPEIDWVTVSNYHPLVTRTLRDARIQDPVCAEPAESRGARVVSICDFRARRLINYLYEPINAWGDKLFGTLGKDGKAEFECTGWLAFPGHPFLVSGSEIP
jgi:hypothetical protein